MSGEYFLVELHPVLSLILKQLPESPLKVTFKRRVESFFARTFSIEPPNFEYALAPHIWMLRHAAEGGLELTAAGYLRPAVVKEFAPQLPEMRSWIFPVTTEEHTEPVLYFHHYLRGIKLLRKYKKSLLLTKRGKECASSPELLWRELADTLVFERNQFHAAASVVTMIYFGSEQSFDIDRQEAIDVLSAAGWAHPDRSPLELCDLWEAIDDVQTALKNVDSISPETKSNRPLNTNAQLLIREALFRTSVDESGEWS